MTEIGRIYGEALYALACEEGRSAAILAQLKTLDGCFTQEPDFLQLLSAPNLPKSERCGILDDCFRESTDIFVLNFLKILTGKGYIRHFSACVARYHQLYDQANGILPVTAVTAVALTEAQKAKLTNRLHKLTGKQIELRIRLDTAILGGLRLDFDGKRLDGTVRRRLDAVGERLKKAAI